VYQCKNEGNFSAAKIRSAVKRFRDGKWLGKADTLVLCSREDFSEAKRADEVESQATSMKEVGVTFIPWDGFQLSLKLKELPSLVDDFFGREWVSRFCGNDAALRLKNRLDAFQVAEFRRRLSTFYKHVFNSHDPGLPALTTPTNENPLPLEQRFVLPDIDDVRVVNKGQHLSESDLRTPDGEQPFGPAAGGFQRRRPQPRRVVSYEHRRSIEPWLCGNPRSVILGGPGSGKSSLLRFLVADLLSDEPHLQSLAERWGTYLPIWVPFAFWTKRIAESPTNDASLNEAIQGWLKSWDEEQLWPLVEQSLNDERLLLLVDGLDEHTTEETAGIALSRLQVFIAQRELPAVVTSRPHGFEKLGMQTAGWAVGPLSDFSISQQEQLIRIWFTRLRQNIDASGTQDKEDLERTLNREIEAFQTDLLNSGDLRELAKVPLLLSLLIAHKFHHVQLPPSRFKAYESLIDYLIVTHPRRRRLAAAIHVPPIELNDAYMKAVLAYMAFCVQENFINGIVDYKAARNFISEFLMDAENGLGLNVAESRKLSQQILDIGESNLGLLVKRSQSEFGFFHRVFQDYLAAFHIATLDLTQQLAIVEAKCADPQWKEVILSLLHLTPRREDVRSFVSLIRKRKDTQIDQYAIDLLLGEIAFGDFGCSTNLIHELAEDAFTQIEIGSWLPQRERLLKHALDGLQSVRIKDLVKAKLRTWFPDRTHWKRKNVFPEMSKWDRDSDVVSCLWKGLYDEDITNMLSAAFALADLTTGDAMMGDRVAQLAWNEVDPRIRSVAMRALQRGWPLHERLPLILSLARKSDHPELQLASICARVERGEQEERDRKQLLFMGSFGYGLDHNLRYDVACALARGWKNSAELKSDCLRAARSPADSSMAEKEVADVVLLTAFPQDNDVAAYFAEELNREYFRPEFIFTLAEQEFFGTMSKNFKNHPVLIPAVEKFLELNLSKDRAFFYLFDVALVSPTSNVKTLLLSAFEEFPHLIAPVLLDAWGPNDAEIATVLREFAAGPASKACLIGKQIPRVMPDRHSAYNRLLALLQDPGCQDCSPVVEGLTSLGLADKNQEVVDAIFSRSNDDPVYAASSLIKGYSLDPRVRQLAIKQFEDSFGCLDVIASVYGADRFFRALLIEAMSPLPISLRMIIATKLGEMPASDEFSSSILGGFELESEKEVKVQASLNYHNCLWSSGRASEADVELLRNRLSKRWIDLGGTLEASFCGLAALKRLDIMRDLRLVDREESKVTVPISRIGQGPSSAFLRTLLQNWGEAHAVFGEEFWGRFISHEGLNAAWEQLSLFADEYPEPRREALTFFESKKPGEERASLNVLAFIDRVAPHSRIMLDYGLSALAGTRSAPHYTSDEAEYAIQLLGKNFGGDDGVLKELMKLTPAKARNGTEVVPENLILALCEGWVRSDEFQQIFKLVSETNQELTYGSLFQLSCRVSDSENIFRRFIGYLAKARRSDVLRSQRVSRPLIRRLTEDDDLLEQFKTQLFGEPTASQKISLTRLIALARGTGAIKAWCLEEIDRQLEEHTFPEVGVDAIEGQLRPVAHALLDVMAFARN
jgi:hypothetical protein